MKNQKSMEVDNSSSILLKELQDIKSMEVNDLSFKLFFEDARESASESFTEDVSSRKSIGLNDPFRIWLHLGTKTLSFFKLRQQFGNDKKFIWKLQMNMGIGPRTRMSFCRSPLMNFAGDPTKVQM